MRSPNGVDKHSTKPQPPPCSQGEMMLTKVGALHKHQGASIGGHRRTNKGKKPQEDEDTDLQLSCAACPKIFSTRKKMTIHTQKYHLEDLKTNSFAGFDNDETGDKLTCKYCSKSFTSRKHQQRHMASVHSTKVISCEHCGKQFSRSDHLKSHKKTAHLLVQA